MGTTALNVVIDGAMPSGAGDPPVLLSFNYSFGGVNASLISVNWQPLGRVRFKCEGTGVDDQISDWSTVGLGALTILVENMEVNEEYTLYYQIDPEPDYGGWDEGAWLIIVAGMDPNLPTWTQTGKEEPVAGEWETEE